MAAGDLGIWLGVILATIPGLSFYQDYGLWAGLGTYFVSIYAIGFPAGFLVGLLSGR